MVKAALNPRRRHEEPLKLTGFGLGLRAFLAWAIPFSRRRGARERRSFRNLARSSGVIRATRRVRDGYHCHKYVDLSYYYADNRSPLERTLLRFPGSVPPERQTRRARLKQVAENRSLWIAIAVLVLLAGILAWAFLSSGPMRLIVLFDEIGGLKKDAPVVWRDFTIGKVVGIQPLVDNQFGVTIELREDYASKITRGSEFYLKPAPLLGIFDQDVVEVVTPQSPLAPFTNGEKVRGKRYPASLFPEQARRWSQEYLRELTDQAGRLIEAFRDSPYRKDAEEVLRQLKEIGERGAALAKDQLEDFRRAHEKDLERIRKKLEQIRDEMRKRGDNGGAEKVEKEIGKMK